MSQLASKIFYNTAWQIIIRAAEILTGVITLGLITRYLGQTDFGYYTTVLAWLQVFLILIDLGLYLTLLKEISARPDDQQSFIVSNFFTLRLVTTAAFLFISWLVVQYANFPLAVSQGVLALAFGYLCQSLITTVTAVFQKNLAMPKIAIASLLNKLILLGLLITVMSSGGRLQSILYVTSAASFINLLIVLWFLKKYLALRLAWQWAYWLKILKQTWPLALTIALNLIYFKMDTLFLAWYRPAADVGLYGATYRVLEIITTFPHMFMGLIMPLLMAAWVSRQTDQLTKVWRTTFHFFAFLTLPLIFGSLVVATPLMTLVAGSAFAPAGPILKILMLATGAIFYGTLYTYLVLVVDQQRKMIKYFALAAVLAVLGYWLLIPTWGYWAAAWVTVAVEILIVICSWSVTKKYFQARPSLSLISRLLLASLLMAGLLKMLDFLPVILLLGLGLLSYLALTFLFKVFSLAEIKNLVRPNNGTDRPL